MGYTFYMHLGELLLSVITAVLGGFLAVSNFFAMGVERGVLVLEQLMEPYIVEVNYSFEPSEPKINEKDGNINYLPSRYEKGGPIPDILLRNPQYQRAAVVEGIGTSTSPIANLPVEEQIREAIVNIFCTYRDDTRIRATAGSGVFIDPRGVILTNAHIAQFLLLSGPGSEPQTRCVIRQGNPAVPRYEADLLYISPLWIRENAALIDSPNPMGTGERDYALLYVSEALDGDLPLSFPALTVNSRQLRPTDKDRDVLAAGYPAEILRSEGPRADLIPKVANTTITELFTFGSGNADLIAIGPSAVGEQGSSGGPVASEDGSLIGLIVTRGNEEEEGARSLRALTLSYISKTIFEETGFDLKSTLTGDLTFRGEVFRNALVPFLSYILENELN